MKQATLTLDRFLNSVVPGALLLGILWYLHRPFLMVRFPHLAGDPSVHDGALSTEGKLLVLIPASLLVGVVVNYLADSVIGALFVPERVSKGQGLRHRLFSRFLRVLTWRDPCNARAAAVNAYLSSPRRVPFLALMEDWAYMEESELKTERGASLAVEHVVVRMKCTSAHAASLERAAHSHVQFTSSMFTALALAIPLSMMSWATSSLVDHDVAVPWSWVILTLITAEVLAARFFAFLTVRRYHYYCGQAITLALHCRGALGPVGGKSA